MYRIYERIRSVSYCELITRQSFLFSFQHHSCEDLIKAELLAAYCAAINGIFLIPKFGKKYRLLIKI